MNELVFLLHIFFVVAFSLVGFYIGKHALIAIVSLQTVLANLFVIKQIEIFGLNATCADVFIVGSLLGINLLQEYYGKVLAKKTLYISFFCMLFYLIMSKIHVFYIPAAFDSAHGYFHGIFKFTPRITIASMVVYFVVLFINNKLYDFLKNKFNNRFLLIRNFISVFFTQFLDTTLFVLVALYDIVDSVWQVILVSFMLKIVVIFISTPFVGLSKIFFKEKVIIENGNRS